MATESIEQATGVRISKEALDALRARIGKPVRRPRPYIEEITHDSIRHYADGIGDLNPLWTDRDYAAGTRFGGVVGLPTMLYAADRVASGYVGGLPGVHAMFAGTEWEWYEPLRPGDAITGESVLLDLVEKQGQFAGRTFQQIYRTDFVRADGVKVARADSWCFRTERDTARSKGKYAATEISSYTREEIDAIVGEYAQESIRGAETRYHGDVQVGDELPQVIKGPLTATGVIAFVQGWGSLYIRAHGLANDLFERHPALGIPNEQGVPEPPERVHWDPVLAAGVGVPAPYDYGPERVSWLGNVATNWMGDEGTLRSLSARVLRHNLMGDVTRCAGRVTGKREEGERALVDVELWADNQRGERSAAGTAVVELPRRTA
jgi:acyl dehydratase